MIRFLVFRFSQAALTIFGVVSLVFFLQRLTGDPVALLLPETATEDDIKVMREVMGLDQPVWSQYGNFLFDTFKLDFGFSFVRNAPVSEIITSRIPETLELAIGALAFSMLCGFPLGLIMAFTARRQVSKWLMAFVLACQSLPTFWSGIVMILVFGVWLQWLPTSGTGSLSHLIMPSISLGLLSLATYARMTRTAVLEELDKDYIRSARARGVRGARLVRKHLLRNSLVPIVSISAIEVSQLLAGAVVVETVFAWPGLGLLTMQSIAARDFSVVQIIVLLGSFITVSANLISDLLYSIIDPRIRL